MKLAWPTILQPEKDKTMQIYENLVTLRSPQVL